MKIIAVMTQKGGVGKTMTASSLAYILGVEHGKRVLIADADQQGNISMLYGRFEPQGIGMSELLEKHRAIGGTYSTEQLIDETPYQNISIIPANGFLMRTNMTLLLLEQDNQILRFKMAMEEIQDRYDYCIVDCGLLMDMTVTNVLVAADLVILPVKVGGFEIEAIVNMEEQLEDLRGFNPDIRMKLLMTMRQKNMTSLQVEEWLKAVIRSGLLPDGNQTLDRGREGNNGACTSAEVLKERNRRKGLQRSSRRVAERHGGIKDDVRRMVQRRRQHGRNVRNDGERRSGLCGPLASDGAPSWPV